MKRIYSSLPACLLILACFLVANPVIAQKKPMQSSHQYYLFIGTYSPADSNGIMVYHFDSETGQATYVSAVSGIENPSFLALSPDHRFLYAVSEMHGEAGGEVYAYAFDAQSGKLHFINKQLSNGKDPCNIVTDKTGKWLFVANYSSGNFSEFPIEPDGSIGKLKQTIQHHGRGIHLPQQSEAHVHCVIPAPNNRDIFVTDLGLDKVFTYELDAQDGKLNAGEPPFTKVLPGSGPRILKFSPDGKFLYLIHEIGGNISVFAYTPGKLNTIQTLSDVPENFQGKIWAADIHFSPDGKFLYASNRDDLNNIVTYAVNETTGKLAFKNRIPSGEKTPRYFTLTPDGNYLLAGHQNGDNITIFKRNSQSGLLTNTGEKIHVPHTVCMKMISVP